MAVYKLDDVFCEDLYILIGIHCTIEDYRLAYLLNKHLSVNLIRKPLDLDYNDGKSSYSIFEWEDNKQLITWNLVSNICKTTSYQDVNYGSLFENQEQITRKTYLLPEYKRVNYFLKIDSDNLSEESHILNTILKMPQVITAYGIDINKIKYKDNLIFS